MKSNRLPRTVGGSREGEEIAKVYKVGGRWPPVIYKASRITLAEHRALKVDENIMRRPPDDVYEFNGTDYIFRERVDY